MPIEITGPQNYEYQYLLSVFIGMTAINLECQTKELFIEKSGSEDVELKLDSNIFFIQIKNENIEVDLTRLANVLNHYSPRQVKNNILQKLLNDTNNHFILITSCRVKDDCSCLVSNFSFSKFDSNNIDIRRFFEIFKCAQPTEKGIARKRLDYQNEQVKAFKKMKDQDIKEIFNRIIIWERINNDDIYNKLKEHLNKKWFIPDSILNATINELLEYTKKCRDNRVTEINALGGFKNIIENQRVNTIFKERNVVERPTLESSFIDLLESTNLLLLTGISLTGKTFLAKKIAYYYQKKGFNAKLTDSFDILKDFIQSEKSERRICVFDDPFGHAELISNSLSTKIQISEFIKNNLSNDRKIIITSRIDLIKKLYGRKKYTLNSSEWVVIKNTEKQFLEQIIDSYEISEDFKKLFNELLKTELLEVGQLCFLLNNIYEIKDMSMSEIISFAKQDAHEIGTLLNKDPDISTVLRVITLGASTIDPINLKDFKYIMDKGLNLLSYDDSPDLGMSSTANTDEFRLPEYENLPRLNTNLENALDHLEKHGYIRISEYDDIYFTHPNYLEAGWEVLRNFNRLQTDDLIKIVEKGMFSLNPTSASMFVSNLTKLINSEPFKSINSFIPVITKLSFKALDSFFPIVEDAALQFLVLNYKTLSVDQFKKLKDIIQYSDRSKKIYFDQELVFYEKKINKSFLNLHELTISEGEILYKLRNVDKNLNFSEMRNEEIWNALLYLEHCYPPAIKNQKEFHLFVIKNRFSFIRERSSQWLARHYHQDESVLKELLKETHPLVCFRIIEAIFEIVNKRSAINLVSKYILKMLSRIDVLLITYNYLFEFKKVINESNNRINAKIAWVLWYEVFPVIIKDLKDQDINIDFTRFADTIEGISEILNVKEMIKLCEIILEDIIKPRFRTNNYLDFDAFWFLDVLIIKTKRKSIGRSIIINELISIKSTTFTGKLLSSLFRRWKYITNKEKKKIIRVITKRKDSRWLKAIALTNKNFPEDLRVVITGEDTITINMIDQELLNDAIYNIFCNYCADNNGVFELSEFYYWTRNEIWFKLINDIIDSTLSADKYNILIRKLVYHILSGSDLELLKDLPDNLIKQNCKIKKSIISDNIIFWLCNYTRVCNKTFIFGFYNNLDKGEKEEFCNKIYENFELIEIYDNFWELFEGTKLIDIVFNKLTNERLAIFMTENWNAIPEESSDLLAGLLKIKPMRSLKIIDFMLSFLKDKELCHSNLYKELEINREYYFRDKIVNIKYLEFDKVILDDWLF